MMHSVVPSQQQQQQQQQSNENGIGKTPARSATRRALGDISNRKVSNAVPFNDNIGSKTPLVKKVATTTTSIYKDTSKSVLPKEVNPEVLRNASNNNQQLQQQPNHQPSLRVTTTATTTTTNRNKSNNVTFILPDDTKNHLARIPPILPAPHRRVTTLNHINTKHHSTLWNYDDESEIELPAGRLYHQQLLMYDDDDNDSQISLEGAKTFREDFVKVLLDEHNEAMQEKEKYIQYCIEQLEQNCIITDDDKFMNDDHDSFDTTDEDECCLTTTLIVDDHTNSTADVELLSTYIDFPPPL